MCVSCNQKNAVVVVQRKKKSNQLPLSCDYTKELLQSWKDVILCVKNNNTYKNAGLTKYDINRFLGVINAVTDYNNDPCLFVDRYEEIYQAVAVIQSFNLCP